jgi:hypothetical protein
LAEQHSESKSEPRYGFESTVAGKFAECDGGSMMGPRLASRQDFRGTLTGEFVDDGDPPWRWYLMRELTLKPESYVHESVWCEVSSIFMAKTDGDMPPGPEAVSVGQNKEEEESEK